MHFAAKDTLAMRLLVKSLSLSTMCINICIYLILNSSLNFLTNNCNLFLDLSVLLWILCHVLHTRAGNASYAAAGLALEKIFDLDFLFSQAKFSKYKMVC